MADPEEKIASVIVPDYQLSLAIGKEGQNARLAARLTGYKIDIKSETQAIEAGDLPENYMEQMGLVGEEGYTGDYDDEYSEEAYADYDENGAYVDGAYAGDAYDGESYDENASYDEDSYEAGEAYEPEDAAWDEKEEEIEFIETENE